MFPARGTKGRNLGKPQKGQAGHAGQSASVDDRPPKRLSAGWTVTDTGTLSDCGAEGSLKLPFNAMAKAAATCRLGAEV